MSQYRNQGVQPGSEVFAGALAGFIATFPMTIFMLTTQRFLPKGQRYDLPPELIIKDLAHKAHVRWRLNKSQILGATLVSHFGYGATMGTLYTPLRKLPFPTLVQGILFGLIVWAASYLGLLPLLGISASGHKEPLRRNLMMIAAHIVWGATLGVTDNMIMLRKQ